MCGIVGICRSDVLTDQDRCFLEAASETLAHRGPDAHGTWISERAGFAHRRLSIIDIEGGAQPMHDASERYTIVYNGEIYNYREIRRTLESNGVVFRTNSDTEVALNAYALWGPGCVARFNGIFALGIWDGREQTLFLARDHMGVKPLVYWSAPGCLIFASEIKALLCHPAVTTDVDLCALSDYLSLGYTLCPKTIYRDIRKTPPATWIIWQKGQLHSKRYWDLSAFAHNPPPRTISEEAAIEELRSHLNRSVRAQLVSDVPVGAFLSGGIDSSTIVKEMVSSISDTVKTFSIGFKERSYNESSYARLAAEWIGTQHFERVVSQDLAALLPKLVACYDEPFADTSAAPTFLLCKWAREFVKVVLSGDGGDECFAGYDTYVADKLQMWYRRVPALIHRAILSPLTSLIPSTHRKVSWDYKIKQFVRHAQSTPEEAHYSWRLIFSEEEKRRLMGPDIYRSLEGYTPFDVFMSHYADVPDAAPLNRSLYVDAKTWLVDAMLVKVDRASMAHGLEVRVPLLDRELVEFAMSLPPRFKLQGLRTKAILKKAMADSLPPGIIDRKKRGFNAPVAHWIERFGEKPPSGGTGALEGCPQLWPELMREHRAHRADNSFKLWTLLLWLRWEHPFTVPGDAPFTK
ncbi:MAG: asparagine synthase (glutamine-hydrolyzing) [Candidatus Aureabacteria bacterium]|nr:asparagine synthase (glutamine-hydrolyzing) [Candidatus Auribacterota bacterium]